MAPGAIDAFAAHVGKQAGDRPSVFHLKRLLNSATGRAAMQGYLERLGMFGDARFVQLLVERVDIALDGADIRMRTEGLTKLVADLGAIKPEARRAA